MFSHRSRIFLVQPDQNTTPLVNQSSAASQPNICIRLSDPSYYPTTLPPSPCSESGSLPKSIVEADCAPESPPALQPPAVSAPGSPCSDDQHCPLVIKEESGHGGGHGDGGHGDGGHGDGGQYQYGATYSLNNHNCKYCTSDVLNSLNLILKLVLNMWGGMMDFQDSVHII